VGKERGIKLLKTHSHGEKTNGKGKRGEKGRGGSLVAPRRKSFTREEEETWLGVRDKTGTTRNQKKPKNGRAKRMGKEGDRGRTVTGGKGDWRRKTKISTLFHTRERVAGGGKYGRGKTPAANRPEKVF